MLDEYDAGYENCINSMVGQIEDMQFRIDQLNAENVKLRELVADMWFWGYKGHMDNESLEWQMKHIDGVLNRMLEFGIEI